jgi:hypothetical protein
LDKEDFEPGYYYLHANSQIIWAPFAVTDYNSDYFNLPHIIKHWRVETIHEYNLMRKEAKDIDNGV